MSNAQYAYEVLKENYEIDDDNVGEYRYAISFRKEYAAVVQKEAQIVIESINLGQSTLTIGELMKILYHATHKLVNGTEYDLPGVEYFNAAAKISFEAVEYITSIAAMTEEWAECTLSCEETVDVSYM